MMKYELIKLEENHKFYNTGVKYQIKALKDFGNVKKGELGGYVANENNLSQKGNCWIYGNGRVKDNGVVHGNGRVKDYGVVHGNGRVKDYGRVIDYGIVKDNGIVYGNGIIYGNGIVKDNGIVYGNGIVGGVIEGDYECKEKLYYPKMYKYIGYPVFDKKGQKPTHIRMGCFTRTIKEWQEDFYNNNREFSKGKQKTKQRLYALNYILMSLGEEIIYLED